MQQLGNFADVEDVMMTILNPVGTTCTVTPAQFDKIIRVRRLGGTDDGLTDKPVIEVSCMSTQRDTAWAMAEQCRQIILACPATSITISTGIRVTVDSSDTVTPITRIYYEDHLVANLSATYRLQLRRPKS